MRRRRTQGWQCTRHTGAGAAAYSEPSTEETAKLGIRRKQLIAAREGGRGGEELGRATWGAGRTDFQQQHTFDCIYCMSMLSVMLLQVVAAIIEGIIVFFYTPRDACRPLFSQSRNPSPPCGRMLPRQADPSQAAPTSIAQTSRHRARRHCASIQRVVCPAGQAWPRTSAATVGRTLT